MNPRIAVAVSAVLLTAACSGGGSSSPGGSGTRYVEGDKSVKMISAGERKDAVKASGEDLDGKTLDLTSFQGKVTVVNFWASWCAPCRAEAPALEQVYSDNKDKGVAFVGVDIKDTRDAAKAFLRTYKSTYPSFFDPQARITLAFRTVNPSAVPTTLILDKQGRVAVQMSGQVSKSKLDPVLAQIMAEK